MPRKLALWFVLLIVGFLTGFILQYCQTAAGTAGTVCLDKTIGLLSGQRRIVAASRHSDRDVSGGCAKTTEKQGRTRKSSSIKLSEFRVARRIPHFATCFVTHWQPAIRSQRIWQRETQLHFQKYSHSCPRSSRPRSIKAREPMGTFSICR